MDNIKEIIMVLSGKGGVGKSTVSTYLALVLREKGFKVGLLDVDLCGPSVPYLLGLEGRNIYQSSEGWVPIYFDEEKKLAVMSIGFLLNNRNESVVWRGPKKTSLIKQFLTNIHWQNLDYLIIDTPPGTSDEHITVMESLRNFNNKKAILVTTPQAVAIEDVLKEISFCKKTGIPILGVIENMSTFVCPHCTEATNIFSKGGGESLAAATDTKFLGMLPLDSSISELADSGPALLDSFSKSAAYGFFDSVLGKIIAEKA